MSVLYSILNELSKIPLMFLIDLMTVSQISFKDKTYQLKLFNCIWLRECAVNVVKLFSICSIQTASSYAQETGSGCLLPSMPTTKFQKFTKNLKNHKYAVYTLI